jgi:hypothetical protein
MLARSAHATGDDRPAALPLPRRRFGVRGGAASAASPVDSSRSTLRVPFRPPCWPDQLTQRHDGRPPCRFRGVASGCGVVPLPRRRLWIALGPRCVCRSVHHGDGDDRPAVEAAKVGPNTTKPRAPLRAHRGIAFASGQLWSTPRPATGSTLAGASGLRSAVLPPRRSPAGPASGRSRQDGLDRGPSPPSRSRRNGSVRLAPRSCRPCPSTICGPRWWSATSTGEASVASAAPSSSFRRRSSRSSLERPLRVVRPPGTRPLRRAVPPSRRVQQRSGRNVRTSQSVRPAEDPRILPPDRHPAVHRPGGGPPRWSLPPPHLPVPVGAAVRSRFRSSFPTGKKEARPVTWRLARGHWQVTAKSQDVHRSSPGCPQKLRCYAHDGVVSARCGPRGDRVWTSRQEPSAEHPTNAVGQVRYRSVVRTARYSVTLIGSSTVRSRMPSSPLCPGAVNVAPHRVVTLTMRSPEVV